MAKRALALGSHPSAEDAALEHLERGGTALGAVLAGFFSAAGSLPGVLFSPMSALIGGIGVGSRAFDGRLRQPGFGLRRPRGFEKAVEIPMAARVAVPFGPIAAVMAHAYDPESSLKALLRHGIAEAKRCGASERRQVLTELGSTGARLLAQPRIERSLLSVANPSAGGLMSRADLIATHELDCPALVHEEGAERRLEVPWAADSRSDHASESHAIIAIDSRGCCAALSFANAREGVALPDLELLVPLAATPVERGVPRRRPGSPLPAYAPLAILLGQDGIPLEVAAEYGGEPTRRASTLKLARAPNGQVRIAR